MRKQNREITDRAEMLAVMEKCDVCRLAVNDPSGFPYMVPLNFGIWDDGKTLRLIFHSATEGYKLDLFRKDPRASFEMDTGHVLQYFPERGYCTMSYESIMGRGVLSPVPETEKAAALQLLMDHYHPGTHAYFNPAAIPRTVVYQLTVESMTGKRKPLK